MSRHAVEQCAYITSTYILPALFNVASKTPQILVWVMSLCFVISEGVLRGLTAAMDVDSAQRSDTYQPESDPMFWQELDITFVHIVFVACLFFVSVMGRH
ncbi:hypothetical protein F5B20DRAFT_586977 [Whalleya microplaca]|nr:hypothetical protein F5B20DRAFT_586977 [Whalleya microplaca]